MSKYHNKQVTVDGIRFDSVREANRWQELKLMERAHEITELQRQVPFKLVPTCKTRRGKTVYGVSYIADFVYKDKMGRQVVEDAKGIKTEVYKLKYKLMLWIYGIEIQEV
jgi:hypothetical protein